MILVVSLFLALPAIAGRKEAKFNHIPIRKELARGIVFDIFQDIKGFIWFGTNDGLVRYDGHNFRVYRKDDKDSTSISDNAAPSIMQDSQGFVWVGTNRGLNRFDPRTEHFTHYFHDPENPESLSNNVIRSLCEDRSGFIWVGTLGGGLNRLDPRTGLFTRYQHDPENPYSLSDDMVWSLAQGPSGFIWIGTLRGGLNRFDPDTERFTRYMHDPEDDRSISLNRIAGGMVIDQSGTIWVGTEGGGLNRLDPKTGHFAHYRHDPGNPDSLSQDSIRRIYEDHSGYIWMTTVNGGINRLDPKTGIFDYYRHEPANPGSLAADGTWGLCEDRAGNIWVGTFYRGIDRFNPNGTGFKNYRNIPDDPFSLSHDFVTSIDEDAKGGLWVGTMGGGLNRLDRKTGRFLHYKNDPTDPASLSSNLVRAVNVGPSGAVWVGTENAGLNRLEPSTGRFTRFRHDPENSESLSGKKVMAVLEDSEGEVWAGTFDTGLNRLDPKTNRIKHYYHDPSDPFSLGHDGVWDIYEDTGGALWLATYGGGLNRLGRGSGRFTRYKNKPGDPSSLSHNIVYSLCESTSGVLWIGTARLLDRFDRQKGTFVRYGRKEGLAADSISGILEDDSGRLWVSSAAGLSRLDPSSNEVQNFGESDLPYGSEFYWAAYCKTRDGTLFFGKSTGLTYFRPEAIHTNPFAPAPVITRLYLFNRPILTGEEVNGRVLLENALEYTNELTFDHRDSVISFEFAALHYTAPEENQYAYRLEGFEKEWNYSGNRHFATYTNLPPGRYAFQVKAANYHGLWDRKGTSLEITVLPPLWNTWWFRIMLLIAVLAFGLALHLNRTRLIRKRSRKLEQTVTERTRALEAAQENLLKEKQMAALGRVTATVSHEMRNPLSVIRSSVYYLKTKLNQGDDANVKHLNRINNQVSQCDAIVEELLEYTTGREPVLFRDDLGPIIQDAIGNTAALSDLKVTRDIASDLPKVALDRDKMRRVVVNLLQNAAQAIEIRKNTISDEPAAAYDPKIKVRAYARDNHVFIEVEDNGTGMDPETLARVFEPLFTSKARGTGLGLSIARKIVEEHKGTLTLESRQGKGTTAVMSLPIALDPHPRPQPNIL